MLWSQLRLLISHCKTGDALGVHLGSVGGKQIRSGSWTGEKEQSCLVLHSNCVVAITFNLFRDKDKLLLRRLYYHEIYCLKAKRQKTTQEECFVKWYVENGGIHKEDKYKNLEGHG